MRMKPGDKVIGWEKSKPAVKGILLQTDGFLNYHIFDNKSQEVHIRQYCSIDYDEHCEKKSNSKCG